ncbi:neuralized-like protein 4 [Littorina saxatilis]|uniref:NHR domain-containing protein n=1 Tax=Littorina saxatilis TaxID=31220 RepID=A0AAN9AX60_9CAEN
MWQFHSNHGQNIVLSEDGVTASSNIPGGADHGIVVSSQPMEPSVLYEVKVEEIHPCWSCPLPCGVVRCPDMLSLPASASAGWDSAVVFSNAVYDRGSRLRDLFKLAAESPDVDRDIEVYTDLLALPDTAQDDWDSAVVFRNPYHAPRTSRCTCVKGVKALGDALEELSVGSRVGVMVDAARGLHLYVNGRNVTSLARVPTPCYAFFELLERYLKVTAQPLKHVQTYNQNGGLAL